MTVQERLAPGKARKHRAMLCYLIAAQIEQEHGLGD